jgi:hypothetical protein
LSKESHNYSDKFNFGYLGFAKDDIGVRGGVLEDIGLIDNKKNIF